MNAQQLIQDVQDKLWNSGREHNGRFKGLSNISTSDLETAELYAEVYLRDGGLHNLIKPLGNLKDILELYGYR